MVEFANIETKYVAVAINMLIVSPEIFTLKFFLQLLIVYSVWAEQVALS